jgi:hypothetical protein
MVVKSVIAAETRFLAFILRLQRLFLTPVFCVRTGNLDFSEWSVPITPTAGKEFLYVFSLNFSLTSTAEVLSMASV